MAKSITGLHRTLPKKAQIFSSKTDSKVPYVYDVAHEKNRKKQLDLYLRRTRKEIEEQEKLRANEKKSERKKGEREKREAEQVWNKAPKGFVSSQP